MEPMTATMNFQDTQNNLGHGCCTLLLDAWDMFGSYLSIHTAACIPLIYDPTQQRLHGWDLTQGRLTIYPSGNDDT
jgi:hypothetical protein